MTQPTSQILKDFADAWNAHDLEALMTFVTDDCAFHTAAGPGLLGTSFVGTEELRKGFPIVWETFPDAAWLDGEHYVVGDRGVSECTFAGTKADGTRIEARMVDLFKFRDGKICVKNAFRKDRPPVSGAK